MNGKVVQRLQKAAIVSTFVASPGTHLTEDIHDQVPLVVCQLRQQGRLQAKPTRYESRNVVCGNPTNLHCWDSVHTA